MRNYPQIALMRPPHRPIVPAKASPPGKIRMSLGGQQGQTLLRRERRYGPAVGHQRLVVAREYCWRKRRNGPPIGQKRTDVIRRCRWGEWRDGPSVGAQAPIDRDGFTGWKVDGPNNRK